MKDDTARPADSIQQHGPDPLLVDAKQAAQLYGVSPATWHRMVSAGRTPAPVRPSPGTVRWRLSDLREHIALGCPGRKEFDALTSASGRGGRRA